MVWLNTDRSYPLRWNIHRSLSLLFHSGVQCCDIPVCPCSKCSSSLSVPQAEQASELAHGTKLWSSSDACSTCPTFCLKGAWIDSLLRRGSFSRSSHAIDLKIGNPVATLPGAWCYVVSAGTGWPGVSILWLKEIENLICNFCLSVWADPPLRDTNMLLGRSANSKQQPQRGQMAWWRWRWESQGLIDVLRRLLM